MAVRKKVWVVAAVLVMLNTELLMVAPVKIEPTLYFEKYDDNDEAETVNVII